MSKKTTWLVILILAVTCMGSFVTYGQDQGRVTINVLMIQAQNDSAPIDRRLERVEYKLRRVFGFQFYKYVGQGSITLPRGEQGVIELEQGHRLQIRLGGGKGKNAEVRWMHENQALLSTSVKLSGDSPLVLGGVPSNGGKLILVLSSN